MSWEIIGTWVGILFTIIGVVFAMGKQAQVIKSQGEEIKELKEDVKASQAQAIKLATVETDVKYLIQQMTELKTLLQQR